VSALTIVAVALAALMTGLWWGERGRRRAAESLRTYGSPTAADHEPVTRLLPTAEERFQQSERASRQAAVSQETVERALADARAELDAQGIPYDLAKLRDDIAHHLLWGEDVLS
jgi:uncharacterized membrane protein YccC